MGVMQLSPNNNHIELKPEAQQQENWVLEYADFKSLIIKTNISIRINILEER